jgi:hypothetical protein
VYWFCCFLAKNEKFGLEVLLVFSGGGHDNGLLCCVIAIYVFWKIRSDRRLGRCLRVLQGIFRRVRMQLCTRKLETLHGSSCFAGSSRESSVLL